MIVFLLLNIKETYIFYKSGKYIRVDPKIFSGCVCGGGGGGDQHKKSAVEPSFI